MREVIATTALTVTKRELIIDGIDDYVESAFRELKSKIGKDLVNMTLADLKDLDNNFQFILTIKKLENNEI